MKLALESLPEDKRQKIIEVCIDEFSKHGYKSTSTNTLVERSGISKGLLFHYFKSKKGLFLYLFELSLNELSHSLKEKMDLIQEDEFFERVKQIVFLKMNVFLQHYKAYNFITKTMGNLSQLEFQEELQRVIATQSESFNVYEQFSAEYLKEDIKKETAQEVVQVVLEHLSNKYLNIYKDNPEVLLDNPKPLFEELDLYINILKNGMYKNENEKR